MSISNNIVTMLGEEWEATVWVNVFRYTYSYDVNSNILSLLYEEWQTGWENNWRKTYTYDENDNSSTGKVEVWQSGTWGPGDGSLALYSKQEAIYELDGVHRYEASYVPFTGIAFKESDSYSLRLYPNPTVSTITIEQLETMPTGVAAVSVIGMDGREFITHKGIEIPFQIDISSLSPGVYLVMVNYGNSNKIGKFVKN